MGLFNRVLQGIGSALIEKGKIDEQNARDQLLMQRELALKELEFQHDDAQAATQHANRLDEIAATGAETRRTDLTQAVLADRRDGNKAQRDLSHDLTLKGVDFNNSAKLEKLRSKLNMGEADFKARLDQAKTDYEGRQVDHWQVNSAGELFAFDKTGHPVTKSTGFVPPSDGSTGLEGIPGIAPQVGGSQARTAPQQAAPAPAAKPSSNDAKGAALAQVGNAYAFAAGNPQEGRKKYPQMFDPSGKLLPRDQILARVNTQFGQ